MRKTFKKPDLNAPRFRPSSISILTKSLYDKFLLKFPEHANLSLTEFKDIIKAYNKNLYQGVIDNRDGVELPESLGYIFMGSCPPPKKQNIDIVKSMEYGIVANHNNLGSDGYLLKIFYTNEATKYPLLNKQVWAFKADKQFRHNASTAYKKQWPKYIVVDDQKKISALYKKAIKRNYILEEGLNVPKDYDEFNM